MKKTEDAPKRKGKGGAKGVNVYVMIPPEPFRRGPPLNSTTFLRLKSTKKKRRTTPSSIVSEGHRIVSCLVMKYLRNSRHTISPQKHCHQSPKHLRDKYALTTLMSPRYSNITSSMSSRCTSPGRCQPTTPPSTMVCLPVSGSRQTRS